MSARHFPPEPWLASTAFCDWLNSLEPPTLTPEMKWYRIHRRLRRGFEHYKGAQRFLQRQVSNGTHWGTIK